MESPPQNPEIWNKPENYLLLPWRQFNHTSLHRYIPKVSMQIKVSEKKIIHI